MANEDCNNNSVLGDALMIAAVGFGAYKGGRSLIKHYDDLGATVLGEKIGGTMSKKIGDALNIFENKEGNKIREGIDNLQGKILEKDYKKAYDKSTRLLSEANPEYDNLADLRTSMFNEVHETFNARSAADKRSLIDNEKDFAKKQRDKIKQRTQEGETTQKL